MPARLRLSLHVEEWRAKRPFRITGHIWEAFRVLVVELTDGDHQGRGEALPVFYLNENAARMCEQVEAVAGEIEAGVDREALQHLMPPGGARNAVDCAFWDLEAKRSRKSIWQLTGLVPKPVTTAFTIGIEDTSEQMAVRAREASSYPILKIKLNDDRPVDRVTAIREARPDARLMVDANQAWTFEQLLEFEPQLAKLNVMLIEQPLPRGADEPLEGHRGPIALCADESCQHIGELDFAARCYQIINIKLDKTGGLTEALRLAERVRQKGLDLLVGNMGGTSLAMAPAFVLAQLCQYVELDGPMLLKYDREPALQCHRGTIAVPDPKLWG